MFRGSFYRKRSRAARVCLRGECGWETRKNIRCRNDGCQNASGTCRGPGGAFVLLKSVCGNNGAFPRQLPVRLRYSRQYGVENPSVWEKPCAAGC